MSSKAEGGVYVHESGDAKVHVADAHGANQPALGVIALTSAFIARLYAASQAARKGES